VNAAFFKSSRSILKLACGAGTPWKKKRSLKTDVKKMKRREGKKMKKRENERFSTLVLSWISKLTFTSNVPPAVSQGSAIRKSLKRQEVLTSYAMGASPAPAWCFEHSSPPASATSIVVVLFAVVSLSLSQTTFFFGLPCLLKKSLSFI